MAIEDFEAEQALDVLVRADEIKNNPEMIRAINVVAKKKVKAAAELTGEKKRQKDDTLGR